MQCVRESARHTITTSAIHASLQHSGRLSLSIYRRGWKYNPDNALRNSRMDGNRAENPLHFRRYEKKTVLA